MTRYKCSDPTCGGLWDEGEIVYKRIKHWDPTEGWDYRPVCPACGYDVDEVDICPICYGPLESGDTFCKKCIKEGAKELRNLFTRMVLDGGSVDELDEDMQEDFLQEVIEEML